MDIPTIISTGGIVISIIWTAWQEIRFQIDKALKKQLFTAMNQYPIGANPLK